VDHIDNHSSQNEHTRVFVNLVFAGALAVAGLAALVGILYLKKDDKGMN
jgi:hypothetical protein